jgi:AAA family ATP:ADP antiporter
MAAAGLMMAHQVASKAARDALFLSQFPASALPPMIVSAALVSIGLGFLSSYLLRRLRPALMIPGLFAVSGVLHLCEWALFPVRPGPASIAIYVHAVALGAVVLSGFWSLVNETFDPREAKKRFAQIGSAGTIGGIVGGLAAERTAAVLTSSAVLLLLGALHMACALILRRMAREETPAQAPLSDSPSSALRVFARAPYLVRLALLVLLTTSSAAVLDYLFKAQATIEFGRGAGLLRFFALYHSATSILTFFVQTTAGSRSLQSLGLARTVASLPVAVIGASLTSLLMPRFALVSLARGLETVMRGSLFRSGYELFYTPIPVAEKRSVKSVIDVAFDRLGDAAGGGLVQLILVSIPGFANSAILLTCAGLAGLGLWIAKQLDRAYVQVLEKGLLNRAVELDLSQVEDVTTRSALLRALQRREEPQPTLQPSPPLQTPEHKDGYALEPVVRSLIDLRSGNPELVSAALDALEPMQPLLAPQVIRLLAWDEVSAAARRVLANSAAKIHGQLMDCLLDPEEDFAIRRRIPRILAVCDSRLAFEGLAEGLKDPRFEVRFQCGRALDYIHQRNPDFALDSSAIFGAVERELSVDKSVWRSHRLLDKREASEDFLFLDEQLRERANQGLEHIFSLLALALPREPLKVAFRALHTEDRMLRGLALEYLEGTLPLSVQQNLWTVIGDEPLRGTRRSNQEVVSMLVRSIPDVSYQLRELRAEQERQAPQ